MGKVYFLRHQVGGIQFEHPFAQPPTDAQFSAVARKCFLSHGAAHPKTEESYWLRVYEMDVLGPDDVIEVVERGLSVAVNNEASPTEFTVSGVAHVQNRGE